GKKKRKARPLRGNAQICCKREHCPGPSRRAIERGDDRLVEHTHVLYNGAGHTSKLKVSLEVALQQLANNVLDIAARAEALACTSEDNDLNGVIVAQVVEELAELGVDVKGHGVQYFGAVARENGNPLAHLIEKVKWHPGRPQSGLYKPCGCATH